MPTPGASASAQLATQYDLCFRATAAIEGFCGQVLRATINQQTESGPGTRRLSIDRDTGVVRMITTEWPVLAVVSAQYCPAAVFPRTWTALNKNQWDVDESVPVNTGSAAPAGSPQGGNQLLFAPLTASWMYGRKGFRMQSNYIAGYPHAGITSPMTANATTINVDDVTGFSIATVSAPVLPHIYDGGSSETVSVIGATANNGTTGLAMYGPGTVTLSTGTQFAHGGPTNGIASCLLTTMPGVIQRAAILLSVHEALVRGGTATTVQRQPGVVVEGGGVHLDLEAFEMLLPWKRVI